MSTNSRPLVCKLSGPEMQKRKNEVISSLKSKLKDKQELEHGYQYSFNGSDEMLDEITAFIKTERQCCDFFTFNMLVEENIIRFSVTGPDGVKEFIKTELNF